MSYNVTIGGNGGSKFISKTKEELILIEEKKQNTRNNRSPEVKEAIRKKQSIISKERYKNMNDEEKHKIAEKISLS